jgi:hypothetical protein
MSSESDRSCAAPLATPRNRRIWGEHRDAPGREIWKTMRLRCAAMRRMCTAGVTLRRGWRVVVAAVVVVRGARTVTIVEAEFGRARMGSQRLFLIRCGGRVPFKVCDKKVVICYDSADAASHEHTSQTNALHPDLESHIFTFIRNRITGQAPLFRARQVRSTLSLVSDDRSTLCRVSI